MGCDHFQIQYKRDLGEETRFVVHPRPSILYPQRKTRLDLVGTDLRRYFGGLSICEESDVRSFRFYQVVRCYL